MAYQYQNVVYAVMRNLLMTKHCGKELREDNFCTVCNKHITGTPRPDIYCKVCVTSYIDPCVLHCSIPNSWELDYSGSVLHD